MNIVRKTWPFGGYDFNLINKYVNNMADKGYALKKIGSLFAKYEMTAIREYKYTVDYVNQFDSEQDLEEYKKKWANEGWEYVAYYGGVVFFKCRNARGCKEIQNDPIKIREKILLKAKKYDKQLWTQDVLWILFAIANSFIMKEFRIFWTVLAIMYFVTLFDFFRYLRFRKNDINNIDFYTQVISKEKLIFLKGIKWLEKILKFLVYVALGYVLFFKKLSYFLSKVFIIIVGIIVGSNIYDKVKAYNEKRIDKFDFESGKGKLLVISIGMIITIGIMLSFFMIEQNKPKEDILYHIPRMKVECSDKVYYMEHEYGIWDYEHLNGFGSGVRENFSLPIISDLDKVKSSDDIGNNEIKISFLTHPKNIEVRYWDAKNFEEIKSYDEGYKTVETKENTFQFIDGEVVYAVYAEWEEKQYEGSGYYVFVE